WQSIGFIKELISLRVGKPTLVIYTADHGQNLNDQPGAHHCTVSGTPFVGEGLVPLVVFTNYEDARLRNAVDVNYGKLSHFHIFPTIVEYMGFDIQQLGADAQPYSPSIFDNVEPLNKFTYGDAFDRFGQEVKFVDVSMHKVIVLHNRVSDTVLTPVHIPPHEDRTAPPFTLKSKAQVEPE